MAEDLTNYSLRDLVLRQAKLVGNTVVSTNKSYSFPKTNLIYVQAGDIGADYVSGSEGSVKIIREYTYNGATYDLATTTTFKYTDALYPTKPTEVLVV